MVKDLCTMQEQLVEKFRKGQINEEVLETSEDAELFHVERKEQEDMIIATHLCRPTEYRQLDRGV